MIAGAIRDPDSVPSHAAEWLRHIAELDAALQIGIAITLSDLTCLEFSAIRILREEQAEHESQEARREAASRSHPPKQSTF